MPVIGQMKNLTQVAAVGWAAFTLSVLASTLSDLPGPGMSFLLVVDAFELQWGGELCSQGNMLCIDAIYNGCCAS